MSQSTNQTISGGGIIHLPSLEKVNQLIDDNKQKLKQIPMSSASVDDMRTANQRLMEALNQPEIKSLCGEFWKSNELSLLFADSGAGKSILAVQICDALSKGEKVFFFENGNLPLRVLFYDFELTDRQFLKRYSDNNKNLYPFSDNFRIDNVDFMSLQMLYPKDSPDTILFNKIKRDIEKYNPDIIVIDNLTYLNTQTTQDTQIALEVMRKLNEFKKTYNLSILVIAHTPKRSQYLPLTKNDLAGSKHLSNFADSVFAIGHSNIDNSLRYLKQIKPSRSGEMIYDYENVMVMELSHEDNFTRFDFLKFSCEKEHLKESEDKEKEEQKLLIRNLNEHHKSIREIAREIGISKSKVQRILKENSNNSI